MAAGFLLLASLSAYADTEELNTRKKPGWEPSVAVTSGVTFGAQSATVESRIDSGPNAGQPVRRAASGDGWAVSPYVGVNAEFMSPELPMPGGIRVFVNGEYLPTFAADLDIAKEADPKGIEVPVSRFPIMPGSACNDTRGGRTPNPLIDPGCACPFGFGCFPEEGISGVGSRTTATIEQDVFGAAVGVAVPFEIFGRKVMVKPSFGWIRYEVEVSGAVRRAFKIPFITTVSPESRPLPIARLVNMTDSTTKAFNAIGPGLELEMEVHQIGPVQAALFLDAHAYHVLGNREVTLSASATASCSDPSPIVPPAGFNQQAVLNFICVVQYGNAPTDYSADWSLKVNPWLYRVGVGLRFRWTGE